MRDDDQVPSPKGRADTGQQPSTNAEHPAGHVPAEAHPETHPAGARPPEAYTEEPGSHRRPEDGAALDVGG
jgi:hypothetical protein